MSTITYLPPHFPAKDLYKWKQKTHISQVEPPKVTISKNCCWIYCEIYIYIYTYIYIYILVSNRCFPLFFVPLVSDISRPMPAALSAKRRKLPAAPWPPPTVPPRWAAPPSRPSSGEMFNEKPWGLTEKLPSGKHTKNYGKSLFSMGKSTINGHFQ